MSRKRNLKNLKTEKEGIQILMENIPTFRCLKKEDRKSLYKVLKIDYKKYSRSIDGIILKVPSLIDVKSEKDVILVEVKTTKAKKVKELPYGVFFGITKNEEDLFKTKKNFRLCIVHSLTKQHVLITYNEYIKLIQNKRVQYQVNFINKK